MICNEFHFVLNIFCWLWVIESVGVLCSYLHMNLTAESDCFDLPSMFYRITAAVSPHPTTGSWIKASQIQLLPACSGDIIWNKRSRTVLIHLTSCQSMMSMTHSELKPKCRRGRLVCWDQSGSFPNLLTWVLGASPAALPSASPSASELPHRSGFLDLGAKSANQPVSLHPLCPTLDRRILDGTSWLVM